MFQRSKVLHQKLPQAHKISTFPKFYETERSLAQLTTARYCHKQHKSGARTRPPISLRLILISLGRTYTEIQKMYWLMGRYAALSAYNNLMLYQQVLKPVWTYGIQLWGCTGQSNRNIIQRFQNRVLRGIGDAPWYIRNDNVHKDLDVETVDSVIKKHAQSHEQRLNGTSQRRGSPAPEQ